MSQIIKFKRGNKVNVPTLNIGEPCFTLDGYQMYIGTSSGNIRVGTLETHNISTNGNLTFVVDSLYDITSINVVGSILTLPTGNKTGQVIEILVSVFGFNNDNTFTITGNINGVQSNTVTIRASYVKYSFIWSESSQTWVMPLSVIE